MPGQICVPFSILTCRGCSLTFLTARKENVVLQADMRAVLIDFSIAASLDDAAALRACAGTPGQSLAASSAASALASGRVSASLLHAGYVAPEIIEGRPYDEGVDVFSAGVLWQLVCTNPTNVTSI